MIVFPIPTVMQINAAHTLLEGCTHSLTRINRSNVGVSKAGASIRITSPSLNGVSQIVICQTERTAYAKIPPGHLTSALGNSKLSSPE